VTHVADLVATGTAALDAGHWDDARKAFEASLVDGETAHSHLGLARALWWRGDNQNSVDHCTAAYSLFRKAGDVAGAVECALWLAITYKANFANFAAANGWIARAERLLEQIETGPPHAWAWVTRAYRMTDLDGAATLTQQALDLARVVGDVDLELIATSQLGLILVGQGGTAEGFALIDEAMAAALGGEPSDLVTVVYTCCDMLNACELVHDAERAAQWCQVADQFVERYGCPFLYAECRIYYGSVLTATGRWSEAEQQLDIGVQNTAGACPGLHRKALTRLANLRIRQGRLEEADQLLAEIGVGAVAESDVTLSAAALSLARGDGPGARRLLEHRWRSMERHRAHLVVALDLLVDAHLAVGDVDAAATSATHLADVAAPGDSRLGAVVRAAAGRVAGARGDEQTAAVLLEEAAGRLVGLGVPFEAARTQFQLGRVLASRQPDVAIGHARRALACFEQLGAALDADRVAAFLRSMGVPTRAGPKGVGALTTREQEVLALIARGLSNPEIAERLYVSRKTAAHHVSRILSKLNLRNRAAAAVFATGAGASTPRRDA
jgi:DNA-binding CsgD family transcriptional regulator